MYLKEVSQKSDLAAIERIYTESFPDNERAPMKLLKKRAAAGKADFLAVCEGEQVVGMAYVVCLRDLAYLFYLAVDKQYRGKGYGTATIKALLKKYSGKRFFLALEQLDRSAENYSQRLKRREFYKSCGLTDLPFRLKEGPVTFAAMGGIYDENTCRISGDMTVSAAEYRELMTRYMGIIMRCIVDVRLLPDNI